MDEGGRRWNGGRYCKTYMRRGLVKPRRKKQLAPTCCICIGKQTAAGSLWLARKMNKIMKKKGKFRVEMQKSNGGAERGEGGKGQRGGRTVSCLTAGGWNVAEERAYERGFAVRFSHEGCKSSARKFRGSFFSVANGSFSSTYVSGPLLSGENLIARENYKR